MRLSEPVLSYIHYIMFPCSWVSLVSKNYEIERACVELENELDEMQRQPKKKRKKTSKTSGTWQESQD